MSTIKAFEILWQSSSLKLSLNLKNVNFRKLINLNILAETCFLADELKKFKRLVYAAIGSMIGILCLTTCIAVVALVFAIAENSDKTDSIPVFDPCSSGPCLNQGTCVNVSSDTYICSCVSTYFGRNCEQGKINARSIEKFMFFISAKEL